MLENIDPMTTLLALDDNDDLSSDRILYLLRYGETEDRDKFVEIMMQEQLDFHTIMKVTGLSESELQQRHS